MCNDNCGLAAVKELKNHYVILMFLKLNLKLVFSNLKSMKKSTVSGYSIMYFKYSFIFSIKK